MLLMAIDLTFIHQRPQAIAIFMSLGPFPAYLVLSVVPRITNGVLNWRTFYLIFMIPCITAVVFAFLFYPETYFLRPAVAFDGRVLVQSATEKVKVYEDWEEVPGGKALPDTPATSKWSATIKELKIWGKTESGWEAMWACYPQILLCMVNPLVFWVALLHAIVFGSLMSIGETYSTTLSGAPYFLPNNTIALVNLGAAFGVLLAWPTAGLMISMISRRLAINNKGVRDAEHFLPAFVVPIISGIASVTLYGLTVENKWHPAWVYIAYTLNGLSVSSLAVANTLWVTEAFPRWAAPALVVLGGWSYIASFGTSYAIFPWIKSQGYARMNIEIALMIFVVGGMIVPVAFWGKSLRQYIHGRLGMNEAGALRPQ
jgi:MFS family permease